MTSLFSDYGLCTEVADPTIINDIPPASALQITHALHEQLRFTMDESGMIFPWAPEDDIIAACAFTQSQAALDYCDLLDSRCNLFGCNEIGYIPSLEAVEALVPALNTLYGIE